MVAFLFCLCPDRVHTPPASRLIPRPDPGVCGRSILANTPACRRPRHQFPFTLTCAWNAKQKAHPPHPACLATPRSWSSTLRSLRLRQMYRHRVFCARQTASLSRYPGEHECEPHVLPEVQAIRLPAASPARKVHPGGRPRSRACRLYSLQRRLSRPAGTPRTGTGAFGGFSSTSGVCLALRSLNRNPTILSRCRVIVNPLPRCCAT